MSEPLNKQQTADDVKTPAQLSEAVIRIAGNSQDGIQAIGGFLARLAGRSEQDVMTFMTIPSTISGGPSIFQVRVGTGEIVSAGDEADVLIAFYQHSYQDHISCLKSGGIVIYDSNHVEANPDWEKLYHHVKIPISSLTIEAIGGSGKEKGKNIFVLGLLAKLFSLNTTKLTELVTERFRGKDSSVLQNALSAFSAGHSFEIENLIHTFQFLAKEEGQTKQVVMNGNEAIAYGCIAAGIRFGAAYPITPSSDIMELLRHELPKYGGTFIQCEDEIASISTALGAGYAGKLAVTSTSGPGLSLKMEALGWGVMAEVPVIIVDIQRGGPSTGLPTQVEQSDLNIAVYGAHGDAPRIVIAPTSVEDCFYSTIEAANLARKYSVPVIILSDQAIATRIEAFPTPDLENICQDISPDLTPVPSHKPYDLSAPEGITNHRAPGTFIVDGKYPVVTGLEHDEYGHPTGSPKYHTTMEAKRRKKILALQKSLPTPQVYGPSQGEILLVSWGCTVGSVKEAVDKALAAGQSVACMAIRYIHPLPNGLEDIFSRYKQILVVELNDEGLYGYGQLAAHLRSRFCDPRIQGINKTEGLTFKVREILEKLAQKSVSSTQQ